MPLGPDYIDGALDDIVAGWPSSGATWHWWTSDPTLETDPTTVEVDLSVAGLTNPSFASSNYAASSGGVKSASGSLSLGTSTAALDDVGAYWGVVDSSGSIVYSEAADDDTVLEVDESGDSVTFTPPNLTFADGA